MLNSRQDQILASIIREYTITAIPVSSSLLVKKYHSDLSSATVRNEMAFLEEDGFLLKPHTSAGRIPSDKGYRYFVDNLLDFEKLSKTDQKRLQVEMLKQKAQNVRLSRTLAKMLSTSSQCLALSGLVEEGEYYDFGMHTLMEDPEFQALDDISKISASLDLIDERVEKLLENIEEGETKIFIGKENPLKEIQNCSMIISPYKIETGETAIVALIGPKRMQYGRNKTLIDFVKRLIGPSVIILFIIL